MRKRNRSESRTANQAVDPAAVIYYQQVPVLIVPKRRNLERGIRQFLVPSQLAVAMPGAPDLTRIVGNIGCTNI